jgi:hypothetical protein
MERFQRINISCVTERREEMRLKVAGTDGDFVVKPEQALTCLLKSVGAKVSRLQVQPVQTVL